MTHHLSWPAEKFYWTILDSPGLKKPGPLPVGLLPLLDEDIPASVDLLHAVCVPLSKNQIAICAATHDDLAQLPPQTLSLSPASLPACIPPKSLNPSDFNLLVGAYEPRASRISRSKRHAASALALLLACGVLAFGLQRRASLLTAHSSQTRALSMRLASNIAPHITPNTIALHAAHLRDLHSALTSSTHAHDVTTTLATLLDEWPTSIPNTPQSISVNENGASISVQMEGDSMNFIKAFAVPAGWLLEEPRITTLDTSTRIHLQLLPSQRK